MRAVRIEGPGRVVVSDVADPVPGPDEVVVRVAAASVCASDRKLVSRGTVPPLTPGHEVAGWLPDGALVGIHPDLGCGGCDACAAGLENACVRKESVGISRHGGLAELVAVPARHTVPLDTGDVALAPLLEPLACCLHAVRQVGAVAGDRALVVGAGAMGLLAMWALQAMGARVVVSQRSEVRRRAARELGADLAVGPDTTADELSEALHGPPRVALVTAPGASALTWALERVAVGGAVHAFAGTPGGSEVDANMVHYRHLALVGSTGSTLDDYQYAVRLAAGLVDLSRLPRTIVSLDDLPATLTAPPTSELAKPIVYPTGEGDHGRLPWM